VIFRSSGRIRKLNELKSILAEVWLIKPAVGTGPLRAASTEALPQKKHAAPNVPVRGAKSGLGSARTEQKTDGCATGQNARAAQDFMENQELHRKSSDKWCENWNCEIAQKRKSKMCCTNVHKSEILC